MRKVVLLGGSFNPIHYGHLKMMQSAIKQLSAHEGWFVLAHQAPLKKDYQVSYHDRKQMVQMMIKPFRKLKLCEIEKELPQPNYTINTLKALRTQFPMTQFYFLIGSDQALQFDQWKDADKLSQFAQFVVYPRDNIQITDQRFKLLEPLAGNLDISSSAIRQMDSTATKPVILRKIAMEGLYGHEWLAKCLSTKRLNHALRVTYLASHLANNKSINQKFVVGLGMNHDLLKEKTQSELKGYLEDSDFDDQTYYWHGYAISKLLSKQYYVFDKQYLKALYHHGSGNSTNDYSKILYIADKCEPNRKFNTQFYVHCALQNLSKGYQMVKANSEHYHQKKENQ